VPEAPPEALPTRVIGEAPMTVNVGQDNVPEHDTEVVATLPRVAGVEFVEVQ
jgi:hypothetical protein